MFNAAVSSVGGCAACQGLRSSTPLIIQHYSRRCCNTMDGFGVSNYSVDKPSFSFSTRTTEFDDALLSRNIITFEQAMVAKGASAQEAHRLTQLQRREKKGSGGTGEDEHDGDKDVEKKSIAGENYESDKSNSSFEDDDDDEFMAKYRQQRLQELQRSQNQMRNDLRFGHVVSIQRSDWIQQVNEPSHNTWVVVLLTASDTLRMEDTQASQPNVDIRPGRRLRHLTSPLPSIELAFARLAVRFPLVKFVQIPAAQANPDWPISCLPTIFVYRGGQMNQQLTGPQELAANMSESQLEHELSKLGVLDECSSSQDDADFKDRNQRRSLDYDDEEEEDLTEIDD